MVASFTPFISCDPGKSIVFPRFAKIRSFHLEEAVPTTGPNSSGSNLENVPPTIEYHRHGECEKDQFNGSPRSVLWTNHVPSLDVVSALVAQRQSSSQQAFGCQRSCVDQSIPSSLPKFPHHAGRAFLTVDTLTKRKGQGCVG